MMCARRFLCFFSAAATVLVLAAPALAQGPREPQVNSPTPAWLGYLAMLLIAGAVLGVALYPVKRSHMD